MNTGTPPLARQKYARGGTWLNSVAVATGLLVALAVVANAYSYTMITAIPLIQSDAWYFLNGFLGQFIREGFSFGQLFAQATPADTNLPLQKAILFFHTRYFGMDFRVEGLFGTASGIALVLLLARAAAARSIRAWTAPEAWLLAALALSLLSLNSTNLYTWPLAGLWFLPILVAAGYMWLAFAFPKAAVTLLVASFFLGVLLDEVAYPVFLATLGALVLAPHWRAPRQLIILLGVGVAGIAGSRLFYWATAAFGDAAMTGATGAEGTPPFADLLGPGLWKAVILPLSDSVIHQANLEPLFGAAGPAAAMVIGVLLVLAHAWFWWRVMFGLRRDPPAAARVATLLAAAMMLLYYALVAGIVIQRVPVFGFEYLHQPRYVLFYQLNLAALALMIYRDVRFALPARLRVPYGALAVALALTLCGLQFRLSVLAWEQAKYLSVYLEGVSKTMGRVAANPTAQIECADIMTICQFPPEKRRELMDLLIRHQLNLFSPAFQSFHRLRPMSEQAAEAEPAPVIITH
ncbi:MAG: hypothetical protein ABIO75_08765 [Thermomonas sp.]